MALQKTTSARKTNRNLNMTSLASTGLASAMKEDVGLVTIHIEKNKSRSWQECTPWGTDPAKELSRHPVYGQAGRRRLGHDPIRHGRFAAIVIRAKRHL